MLGKRHGRSRHPRVEHTEVTTRAPIHPVELRQVEQLRSLAKRVFDAGMVEAGTKASGLSR